VGLEKELASLETFFTTFPFVAMIRNKKAFKNFR
jgi:hypothetical protein